MSFALQAFKSDTLAADITDSANSMTLTTGSFGTPTGEQMLVIDYNIAAKREIVKCTIDGTAVTSIDRAQDGTAAVAHTSGAKIIMAFVPSHYTGLTDGTSWDNNIVAANHLDANLLAGWLLLAASGTRTAATTFTVTGDVTAQIAVGDKIKLTDTTTEYFYVTAASYSSPSTTITITGGTDYTLVGNPTNIYYSKGNATGHPIWFATSAPTWAGIDDGSGGQPTTSISRFKIDGSTCTIHLAGNGTKAGTTNEIHFTSSPFPAFNTTKMSTGSVVYGSAYVVAGADFIGVLANNSAAGAIYAILQGNITDNTVISKFSVIGTYEF
jgi:hypothetical protein